MGLHDLAERLGTVKALDALTGPATQVVKAVIGAGAVKDVLPGTPIGHPAHPMLTDIPIGSFTSAALLDLFGGSKAKPAADLLVTVGLLAALPTSADRYGRLPRCRHLRSEQRIGMVHHGQSGPPRLLRRLAGRPPPGPRHRAPRSLARWPP